MKRRLIMLLILAGTLTTYAQENTSVSTTSSLIIDGESAKGEITCYGLKAGDDARKNPCKGISLLKCGVIKVELEATTNTTTLKHTLITDADKNILSESYDLLEIPFSEAILLLQRPSSSYPINNP